MAEAVVPPRTRTRWRRPPSRADEDVVDAVDTMTGAVADLDKDSGGYPRWTTYSVQTDSNISFILFLQFNMVFEDKSSAVLTS